MVERKFKLQFAVDPEFMEKLARIKSLLSTKYPKDIYFEKIFNILMIEYLDRHSPEERMKRRNARKDRAQSINGTTSGKSRGRPAREISDRDGRSDLKNEERSRYIPPSVRDEVFARDGGRCTFIGQDGRRCNSRWNIQIDHIIPYAKGGDNSTENLRLFCAKHNRLEAEKEYGTDHMEEFYRRA